MDEAGVDNAARAKVPVGAVEALVANAVDVLVFVSCFPYKRMKDSAYLVASITDGIVTRVSTRSKQSLSNRVENGIFDCWRKPVLWVMAVFVANVAGNAKIIILTGSASNKSLLGKFCKVLALSQATNSGHKYHECSNCKYGLH
jgi:hypothetical protein